MQSYQYSTTLYYGSETDVVTVANDNLAILYSVGTNKYAYLSLTGLDIGVVTNQQSSSVPASYSLLVRLGRRNTCVTAIRARHFWTNNFANMPAGKALK